MATLARDELRAALFRLGELAAENSDLIRLLAVGSITVLELNTRDSTEDVDAVVLNDIDRQRFVEHVSAVAAEKDWSPDWLNDAAKSFIFGPIRTTAVLSGRGIELLRPEFVHLLAMKLCAWRDEVDFADAARLLEECAGDWSAIWTAIQPHLQPGNELKAQYAFDDLWENQRP